MDLQNIQEQLNTEFAKADIRIIFWFDDKGDYAEEVAEIQLDTAKLHILDGENWLYSKWLLNESDPEGKYLVYVMKGMNIIAYFESEDGEKISYDVPIIADSQSDAPEDRTFHEKFTFKSKKYLPQDKYYLVMVDVNDTNNELHRYEFTVDIAFVDDFGF